MDEHTRDAAGVEWQPYVPYGPARIMETSCCGVYEWVCEGGQFLVLRKGAAGLQESGRGRYAVARKVWTDLVLAHRARHRADNFGGAA
ncbi:hypothetical protein ABZW11_04895 [Nonomuraea sp. NPDC004580]|uniref:hypothetical protein n=1 Tax=Nonomuraea sp. NPDC004580 TaxID=3154552 RepID=UPI0033B5DDC3